VRVGPAVSRESACYDELIGMGQTLLKKVWDLHTVRQLPTGQTQLFIGLHLVHEVTSPQAFDALRQNGWTVPFVDRTFATVDHIVPTRNRQRPFLDVMAEDMMASLERNVRDFGIRFVGLDDQRQGIVHIIGPELGLTQPGMTIACGDSHTSTHGAFGSVAFGIGTSQVRDVLASQCLAIEPLKVRRIRVTGALPKGVYAKDVILAIIQRLGVQGGNGYAYEYAGDAVDRMTMDERMTICNMSIEGGARVGYVNPDDTTVEYVRGRPYAPPADQFDRMAAWWKSMASDRNAVYDDEVEINAGELTPIVTWGVNPGQSIAIDDRVPSPGDATDPKGVADALSYMGLAAGQPIEGMKVDVAFIGSCTNARLSDLREAARIVKGKHVANHVKALVVPGSVGVAKAAEREGLDEVFRSAGFEWRGAGCSMCLGMNPDKLEGDQVCASSSNRNFKGRQGSPTGRTLLMSPAMVAAAAVAGEVTDVRQLV
jgi:3-isopropylmalate/(R)-2-methylmalate dehydratase large subunit